MSLPWSSAARWQAVVEAQRGEAAVGALAVEQAERRRRRPSARLAALGISVGVGAGVAGADALAGFGARRSGGGIDRCRRGTARAGRRRVLSVIASPRWPSVTPTLQAARRGRCGAASRRRRARRARSAEPQPASPGSAAASRAGISAGADGAFRLSSGGRAAELEGLGRWRVSRRRRPARRARRARRGRRRPRRPRGRTASPALPRDLLGGVLDANSSLYGRSWTRTSNTSATCTSRPTSGMSSPASAVRVAPAVPALVVGAGDAARRPRAARESALGEDRARRPRRAS